jgi:hypothetical protein
MLLLFTSLIFGVSLAGAPELLECEFVVYHNFYSSYVLLLLSKYHFIKLFGMLVANIIKKAPFGVYKKY